MAVKMEELYFDKPKEDLYIVDITREVRESIRDSRINDGIANIFVGCTTASICTMKYDPEHINMVKKLLEFVAPSKADYMHHKSCGDYYGNGGDTNGKSHMRSALFGPSINVPFKSQKLLLDKYDSIVLMDFDIIKRKRKVIVQMVGK